MDGLEALDVALDGVVDAAFLGDAAQVPVVLLPGPDVLEDGVLAVGNGGDLHDGHVHGHLVVAQHLAEGVLGPPHVGRYLALDDDLGVRGHQEVLTPGDRRRQPQRLAHERRGALIVVVAVRGHAAGREVEGRMVSQHDDHRRPLVLGLVFGDDGFQVMMLVGREAHGPAVVVQVLGERDVVERRRLSLHDAGHGPVGADVEVVMHGDGETRQIHLRPLQHHLLTQRAVGRDHLRVAFLLLQTRDLEAQLHVRRQVAHADAIRAELPANPGIVEERERRPLPLQRRHVLEQHHLLQPAVVEMLEEGNGLALVGVDGVLHPDQRTRTPALFFRDEFLEVSHGRYSLTGGLLRIQDT